MDDRGDEEKNSRMTTQKKEWFGTWFNSPYYHILYKNRDFKEAERFLSNLKSALQIPASATLLDLACGKGRHSIFLNQLGYDVTGVDLSEESIQHASQFENEQLRFAVHDMREPLTQQFDFVLNLFTSFGYFETEEENQQAITTMAKALKPGGKLVIDFMNAKKVLANLVSKEQKSEDGVVFDIQREYTDGHIYKHIAFEDNESKYQFTEKVEALFSVDFIKYFNFAGLQLESTYGNYDLEDFNSTTSDRLILIASKK